MTEADWDCCTDPTAMLEFLRGKVSDRKLRLYAVACSRRYLPLVRDHRVGETLEVAERFADGLTGDGERSAARQAAQQAAQVRGVAARPGIPKWERRAASLAYYATARRASEAVWNVPGLAVEVLVWRAGGYNACDWQAIKAEEGVIHAHLLRDIIGRLPFRPVALDSAWLSWHDRLIVSMAQRIYDSRDFKDMPVLADALEEAGCTNPDVLSHCRQQGAVHVRGCWVIDGLLGKE